MAYGSIIMATVRFHFLPEHLEKGQATASKLVHPSKVEAGCLFYRLYQDAEDGVHSLIIERWVSKEHRDQHQRSEYVKQIFNEIKPFLAEPLSMRWYHPIV